CTVNSNIPCSVMIDSGATTQFINEDFAVSKGIPLIEKPYGETLTVFDGRESADGKITHEVEIRLIIDNHIETCTFQVTRLNHYQLIVGKSWLKKHNPEIDWKNNNVAFKSGYCRQHCLIKNTRKLPKPFSKANNEKEINPQLLGVLGSSVKEIAEKELEKTYSFEDDTLPEPELMKKYVPEEYHDFLPLFLKVEADKLPPRQYIDHAIDLMPGTKPPFGPLYEMFNAEQLLLKN